MVRSNVFLFLLRKWLNFRHLRIIVLIFRKGALKLLKGFLPSGSNGNQLSWPFSCFHLSGKNRRFLFKPVKTLPLIHFGKKALQTRLGVSIHMVLKNLCGRIFVYLINHLGILGFQFGWTEFFYQQLLSSQLQGLITDWKYQRNRNRLHSMRIKGAKPEA